MLVLVKVKEKSGDFVTGIYTGDSSESLTKERLLIAAIMLENRFGGEYAVIEVNEPPLLCKGISGKRIDLRAYTFCSSNSDTKEAVEIKIPAFTLEDAVEKLRWLTNAPDRWHLENTNIY